MSVFGLNSAGVQYSVWNDKTTLQAVLTNESFKSFSTRCCAKAEACRLQTATTAPATAPASNLQVRSRFVTMLCMHRSISYAPSTCVQLFKTPLKGEDLFARMPSYALPFLVNLSQHCRNTQRPPGQHAHATCPDLLGV